MSEINVLDFVEAINAARAAEVEANERRADLDAKLASADRELTELHKAVEQIPVLEARVNELEAALDTANEANSNLGAKYDAVVRELEDALPALTSAKEVAAARDEALQAATTELTETRKAFQAAEDRIKVLERDIAKLAEVAAVAGQLKQALGSL